MKKQLISQSITYSVVVGSSTLNTFESLKEARESVRSLQADSGTVVQIVKNLTKSEVLNTYTAQEQKVMSFVALEPETDDAG